MEIPLSKKLLKVWLLRKILGEHQFNYMAHTFQSDPRIANAHTIDIVVRKDSVERRLEADWIKYIARIVKGVQVPPL